MKRRIVQIAVGLLVVLVIGTAGVVYYIDQIAKWGVERGATYALGVPTHLADMDIGLMSGSVQLARLEVANPPGFSKADFLGLADGRVAVSLRTLMAEVVELPELTLHGIDISLERRGAQANYQPILDSLARLSSSEAPDEPARGSKKFVIRKVTVENINVDIQLTAGEGDETRVPVTIEKIELTDVGSDSQGVVMSQLTGIVTKAILTAVVRKAGNLLPHAIAAELSAGLERLGTLGGATVRVVGEVTAVVGGEVMKIGSLGKEIVEDLGGAGVHLFREPHEAARGLKEAGAAAKDEAKNAGREVKDGLHQLFGRKKEAEESKDGGD